MPETPQRPAWDNGGLRVVVCRLGDDFLNLLERLTPGATCLQLSGKVAARVEAPAGGVGSGSWADAGTALVCFPYLLPLLKDVLLLKRALWG